MQFLCKAGALADHGFETDLGFLAGADLQIEFLGALIHTQREFLLRLFELGGEFFAFADLGTEAVVFARGGNDPKAGERHGGERRGEGDAESPLVQPRWRSQHADRLGTGKVQPE